MSEVSSGPGFSLKPLGDGDLEQVVAIERASFSTPWEKEDFERALVQPGSLCWAARLDDQILGYVIGYRIDVEYHLTDFAIQPERRGEGFGGRLIDAVLEVLTDLGIAIATLEVRASNAFAKGLYRSRGFETIAIRRAYYRHPSEDAMVMLKPIVGSLSEWIAKRHPSGDIS
jgi:ribosomal-protein-alanine N-acetyltransferase